MRSAALAALLLTALACDDSPSEKGDSGSSDGEARDGGGPESEGSDAGDAEEARTQAKLLVLSKLRECGVLGRDGAYTGSSDIYYESRCYGRCLIAERCPDVKAAWCGGAAETDSLRHCTKACNNEPIFCQATLRNVARCDDRLDCPDGSDEAGCDYFDCKDGQRVHWASRCDGEAQCADRSDEAGCSFACRDGRTPSEGALECDGVEHCQDGSDESGCMQRGLIFACASGDAFVEKSAVCNAQLDCADGSDEQQGCAKNLCD